MDDYVRNRRRLVHRRAFLIKQRCLEHMRSVHPKEYADIVRWAYENIPQSANLRGVLNKVGIDLEDA